MNPCTSQLAVDIGNTTLKVAQFGGDAPLVSIPTVQLAESSLAELLLPVLPSLPARWYVSSVNADCERRLQDFVGEHRKSDAYHRLTWNQLPLMIHVPRPERVGIDRLLAALGAESRRAEGRPAIIVDAGTAITVDFLGPTGAFEGGAILASPRTANRGLHHSTSLLPMLEADLSSEPALTIGRTTHEAIHSGLYWGMIGGIRELIDRISEPWSPPPDIFATGGTAGKLVTRLGRPMFWIPDLVLEGIARTAAAIEVAEQRAGT